MFHSDYRNQKPNANFKTLQVAGPYVQQYEVYYKKLDPDGKNEIGAMDAAGFLKKSGLTDEQLGKVIIFKKYLVEL